MGIKPDKWIIEMCNHGLIQPWSEGSKNGISYGVGHYGYDARLDRDVKIFKHRYDDDIDPKNFDKGILGKLTVFHSLKGSYVKLPPYSFALATTIEHFSIPPNCIGLVTNKSTYNRCGLVMGVAVLEPSWEGQITLELSNKTPLPIRLYIGEGICQIIFFEADEGDDCIETYADGKYQCQTGVTVAKSG